MTAVSIDLILERRAHAVRRALVDFQRRALDDLGGQQAKSAIGTIWSSSPCRISVGTSNFFRSSVIVGFGERLDAEVAALKPAIIPCSQNESRTPSETFAPGRL
jgi:hypothetical protein